MNFLTPLFSNFLIDEIIFFIDLNPLFLFIKINPSSLKYKDIKGILFNSSFNIKIEPLKKKLKKKVSPRRLMVASY